MSAGEAIIQPNPGVFPRVFTTIEVVFGKTMPDVDPLGYQPDHPIYEVLQAVGVVRADATNLDPCSWRGQEGSFAAEVRGQL